FCEGNLGNPLCEGTITLFCDYAKGDDIFDDLCNGADYTGARLVYCIDPALETHADCASASDNRATLSALCGTPTAPGTNPFSLACSRAVDIALLCAAEIAPKPAHCTDSVVLPESSAHTLLATQEAFCFITGNANNENCADASVNFVASFDDGLTNILLGGTDYLSLGITETATYNPDALPTAGVVINQGYKMGATDNGFALALVNIASQANPDNEAFIPFVRTRLYAGVLHTTDLGAPIIDNTANGFWSATLNAIIQRDVRKVIGEGAQAQIANIDIITEVSDDFTLVVNFADGTIKSAASDPATFEFTSENTVYDGTTGLTTQAMVSANLIIDGRFNPTGLIYGNTTLDYTGGSDSGGLTGLIGTDGAVAVFTSYDDYRNGNAYVGGFVATAGACLAGRTPFDKTLCPDTNALAKSLRLRLCIERHPAAMPFADNCAGDAQITDVVCSNYGINANPFDDVICANATGLDSTKANFIYFCGIRSGHSLACTTGTTGACIADPYATACLADY
nr:hypothetical protein [Pseudomonadota bacterium]